MRALFLFLVFLALGNDFFCHVLGYLPVGLEFHGELGLSLGEGAGFVLLATSERAREMGLSDEIAVSGRAAACDAVHITAPCREASGLSRALSWFAGAAEIGAINGHGTGTVFNDAMEIKAFTRFRSDIPFHSVKGAIGHCLGAAGVIEAALAIKTVSAGIIPPTVGLCEPEEGAAMATLAPQPLRYPSVLSCNSGFGGINAAVLFELLKRS